MPDEVRDSLMDSQYLAGVKAGWNAANAADPNAALEKIHASRAGYLRPLRDWQKAGRPGVPATPATADERAAFIEAIVPILAVHGHKDIAERVANQVVDGNQLPYQMFVAGRASQAAAPQAATADERPPQKYDPCDPGNWRDGNDAVGDYQAARALAAAPADAREPECPRCNGSGDAIAYSDNGPDATEEAVNCPHCNGHGTLAEAYAGVVAALEKANNEYLALCGKQYFAPADAGEAVASVSISKPGDSLTGVSFMSLTEHGRQTLGKGKHLLYVASPDGAGDAGAPSADLIARCRELLELSDLGESDQTALRALSDTYRRDISWQDRLVVAKSQTHREAMQLVLDVARAQGAQGGKGGEA
ncbi:hypothetical protein NCPPB3923_01630 [Burkholderia glumae]|nr:hypothetical protein NCPPB3923_01630 [Burkholderia glumae]